jgi:hypothetical protein
MKTRGEQRLEETDAPTRQVDDKVPHQADLVGA